MFFVIDYTVRTLHFAAFCNDQIPIVRTGGLNIEKVRPAAGPHDFRIYIAGFPAIAVRYYVPFFPHRILILVYRISFKYKVSAMGCAMQDRKVLLTET